MLNFYTLYYYAVGTAGHQTQAERGDRVYVLGSKSPLGQACCCRCMYVGKTGKTAHFYVYSSYVVFKGVLQRAVVLHTKHPAVVPGPYVTLKWRIS